MIRSKILQFDSGDGTPAGWLLLLLLLLYSLPLDTIAKEAVSRGLPSAAVLNPAAELWRDVRQRDQPTTGSTQVRGVDSGVLINAYGDRWRKFRMQQLIPIGGYMLMGIVVVLAVFYLVRGKVPIEGGESDRKLPRYSTYERMIHWFIASIFLFLAITGLILLFGRPVLIPMLGKETFSILASACKEGHNLMGPLFLLALILVFIKFVRRNIYQKGDLSWLLRGGGIIGPKHVPSNFFNMGEKTMFWMLVLVGSLIVVSGLVLVFPLFGQGREWMELAHVGHAIGALLMIGVIIGHIYIGTIGMEGAIEGMKTGYCDLNWAKEHHDLWASRAEARGEALSNEAVGQLRDLDPLPSSLGARTQEAGK
ncbi:MAG: formate dehydrogenase subunit gamma [Candidatus Thiodiazotropha sp. (ex Epidulcina cf. delphinae)]|nr:formate dehydrogenase subunit gamma [Candidatus Thiodiazotropha sp. (ex Epidulcina cf. delphinae)]